MELQSLLLFDRWMGGHHSCEALAEQLEPGGPGKAELVETWLKKNLSTQMELCL